MNFTLEEMERRLWIEGRHAERAVLLQIVEGWRQAAEDLGKPPGLNQLVGFGVRAGSVEAQRQRSLA